MRKIKEAMCSQQVDNSLFYFYPYAVCSNNLQAQKEVLSYITPNVLTETRCHYTTQNWNSNFYVMSILCCTVHFITHTCQSTKHLKQLKGQGSPHRFVTIWCICSRMMDGMQQAFYILLMKQMFWNTIEFSRLQNWELTQLWPCLSGVKSSGWNYTLLFCSTRYFKSLLDGQDQYGSSTHGNY